MAAAAPTTTQTIMRTLVLEFRADAPVGRLKAGVEVIHWTGYPVPGQQEARLGAAMEELVRGNLEGH